MHDHGRASSHNRSSRETMRSMSASRYVLYCRFCSSSSLIDRARPPIIAWRGRARDVARRVSGYGQRAARPSAGTHGRTSNSALQIGRSRGGCRCCCSGRRARRLRMRAGMVGQVGEIHVGRLRVSDIVSEFAQPSVSDVHALRHARCCALRVVVRRRDEWRGSPPRGRGTCRGAVPGRRPA